MNPLDTSLVWCDYHHNVNFLGCCLVAKTRTWCALGGAEFFGSFVVASTIRLQTVLDGLNVFLQNKSPAKEPIIEKRSTKETGDDLFFRTNHRERAEDHEKNGR